MMRRGSRHSAETRERMRATAIARREQTRVEAVAAAADPEWRRKVSETTKQGMARWRDARLRALLAAWRRADNTVRKDFLSQVGAVAGRRS
jgi:hypothetical protein